MAQSKVMTLERQQQYDMKIKEYIDKTVGSSSGSGSVTSDTGWIDLGCPMGQGFAFYRKIGSMVTIRVSVGAGLYLYASGWQSSSLGTLPEGYRPSTEMYLPIFAGNVGKMAVVRVTSAGVISIQRPDYTDSDSGAYDGWVVSFLTDEISNVTTYLDADEVSY